MRAISNSLMEMYERQAIFKFSVAIFRWYQGVGLQRDLEVGGKAKAVGLEFWADLEWKARQLRLLLERSSFAGVLICSVTRSEAERKDSW